MPFRQVEHTADIALHIEADSKKDLFADAARGLFSLMVEDLDISEVKTWSIELTSSDLESLLVDWLNELVFIFETEGALAFDVHIDSLSDNQIKARLSGEPYDQNRHKLIRQIKAATYHALEIKKNGIWEATVVFDV